MSKKEVDNSKHQLVPAKKKEYVRGNTQFIDTDDNVKIIKGKKTNKNKIEFCYGVDGKIVDDGEGAFAKKIENNSGGPEFFIKFATSGSNIGAMIDPWGLYYNAGDEVRYDGQRGRNKYEYERVTEPVFDMYVKFLKTRNASNLRQAEREVGNG